MRGLPSVFKAFVVSNGPGAHRRAGAKAVAGLMTLMIVAGCGPNQEEKMNDAFVALMKRPNLTEVEASYQAMFQTIRERLTAELDLPEWIPDKEPIAGSSCGEPVSNLDGAEKRNYSPGYSPGKLPEDKWPQALAIVTEVAGKHGFGPPKVVVSGPSDHEVEFTDPYNGSMVFGTGGNTVLAGFTGCHLTEEAHKRGTYQPPKDA